MFNNHGRGVFSITEDMCYDNTMMSKTNSPSGNRPDETTIRLNDSVPEHSTFDSKELGSLGAKCKKYKLQTHHIVNVVILAAVVAIIVCVEYGFMPATKRAFRCRDDSISQKYRGDTIRPWLLAVVSQLCPVLIFVAIEYLNCGGSWREVRILVWRWNKYLIIGGVIANLFVVEILKSVTGELRPHFLETCLPDAAYNCNPGQWVENYTCTNRIYSFQLITDSSRSFPSGHAAIATFSSVYTAAYILARFDAQKWAAVVKPTCIALVLLWGPACGITRINDHRHHWWDVLVGLLIGTLSALYSVFFLASKFKYDFQPDYEKTTQNNSTTALFDVKNKNAVSINV